VVPAWSSAPRLSCSAAILAAVRQKLHLSNLFKNPEPALRRELNVDIWVDPAHLMGVEAVKYVFLIPLALLGSTAAFAQPSIQLGPGGVQIDPGGPRPGPREERIVRQEDGCQVTIIRRIDEYGRRTTRRVRECDEDEE